MRRTLTAEQAAAFFDELPRRVKAAAARAEKANAGAAQQELVTQSSGTHSTQELRDADHPFARRAPNPAFEPQIVNDQGGPFARSWSLALPVVEGDTITTRCRNTSPEAAFMGGTSKMIERPLVAAVQERIRERRKDRVRAEVLAELHQSP